DRGALVTLDGSRSSDRDGDPLTYLWTLTAPAGSSATIADRTAAIATFVADVSGVYTATLVVNDGRENSAPATATVATRHHPPVATAGANQQVTTGTTVILDGSASSDPDGDALSYSWTLLRPAGSSAALAGATTATPTFVADVVGSYTASLTVDDGRGATASASVTIDAVPPPCVVNADAGANQTVAIDSTVHLDGSRSTSSCPSSVQWAFVSKPATSHAVLLDASTLTPTFVPDATGDYSIQLTV